MIRISPHRTRAKTEQQLVRLALRHWHNDDRWLATMELQMRGSPGLLELIAVWVHSGNWRRRCLGMDVAAQLRRRVRGGSHPYAIAQTQQTLLAGLCDSHPEVVGAAVAGLGHRPDPSALPKLLELTASQNSQIRWQVAVALGSYCGDAAIDTLLRLMVDPNDGVRDWATFGLRTQHTADSPQIRAALWQNLFDPNEDVSGEALVGLAARGDRRIADYLQQHLSPACRVYELDAAELLADPSLLSALESVAHSLPERSKTGYWYSCLLSAVQACGPVSPD